MATGFTRAAPSHRYRELLSQYRQLHVEGELRMNLPAEKTYNGASLPRHAARIKELIDAHGARTLLDYGSGKGHQYRAMGLRLPDGRMFGSIPEFWGLESLTCYDPAYEPLSEVPRGSFDGVISTDVLEHCPEQDIPWILEEMFGYARRFLFANVACYAAMKHLPNGENAHCTVRPGDWWREQLQSMSRRHPAVRYEFLLDELVTQPDGRRVVKSQCIS